MEVAPLSLIPDATALSSLDDYRRWWQTTWFVDAPWSDTAEAYMRDMLVLQPDGSVSAAVSDRVIENILRAIVDPAGYRRDYRRITAPALFVFPAAWFPARLPDPEQRARATEWHVQHYRPSRLATIARIRRELCAPEIVELRGGNHNDFLFSQGAEVLAAMRAFLAR
jgi:hypothetical protein